MALVITLASNKKLVQIHIIKHNKNVPSTFFRKVFHFHVKKFFRLGTIFLIAWFNLSYINVITAIVHPLTQGTTSQAHISIHFKNVKTLSRNFFIIIIYLLN